MKIKIGSFLIVAIFAFTPVTFADNKKDDKKSNAIKTKVSEREKPPVNGSSSLHADETYNYMSSPKLDDCTKADFDRE